MADEEFNSATDPKNKYTLTSSLQLVEYATALQVYIENFDKNAKEACEIQDTAGVLFNQNNIQTALAKMKVYLGMRAQLRACLVYSQLLFSQLKKK